MQKHHLWLTAALMLIAAATRLYHIQTQSIWFDEGWSAYAAVQPTLWDAFQADATNPPLYYVLLNISVRFTGDSEFALRWFSLVCGLLVIPLAYQLGRTVFDERAGLYAAFLAAVSPPLWWASQEARMYTLLAVWMCLVALAWHRISDQLSKKTALVSFAPLRFKKYRWWLLLWFAELALLYSHNSGPVIGIWLNIVTLMAWLVRRSLRVPDWRLWFAGQMIVGGLWLPYFFGRFLAVQEANSSLVRRPELGLPLLSQIAQSFWTGTWAMVDKEPLVMGLCATAFVIALLVIDWRKAKARWMIAHVIVLIAALIFGLSILGNELHGRYLVMIVPLLLIPLGDGLAHVQRHGLALVFVALLALNIHFITQDKAYQHDDARAMVQYYADLLDADDTVVAWSYADRYELAYYWERLGVQAGRVILPEGADLDVVLPLLPQNGGDIALNVWYTQRADFRGMLGCVLGNGTINPLDTGTIDSLGVYTVYGMNSLLYRAPQLNLPSPRPLDANISNMAQIIAVGGFPTFSSQQALCLPIQLRLTQALNVDLKAAVRVYNDLGWEVASDDAVFADASQRLTSEAPAGTTMTAYPLLRLPFAAPAGDYRIEVTVYDERVSPSGYDVLNERGGRTLALGTWRTQAGADWTQALIALPEIDSPAAMYIVSDNLALLSSDDWQIVRNGDIIRIELVWRGSDPLPELTLTAQDGSWRVAVPARLATHDEITLDWRAVQVPLDAASGIAELRLPDGQVIGSYNVESLTAQFTEPLFAEPVHVTLPNVGTLVGFTVMADGIDHTQPLPITLIWQVHGTPSINYVVFVQLLDASGRVIAQSDSVPAQGVRPTTGWRMGEYIIDEHILRFNENAAPGTAMLIAGMYDSVTFERVAISEGVDAIVLATVVEVR
jgi:4-amino-4-deoxy-L-arabinose transferase-like glycosyltransferase